MTKSRAKNSDTETAVDKNESAAGVSTSEPVAKAGEAVIASRVPERPPLISLHEFCSRLSSKDRRVEMIGAFEFNERRNSRLKDTAQNFESRFQDFTNKPA